MNPVGAPEIFVSRPIRLSIHLLFLLSGATALVYQVTWLRNLSLVFGASFEATSIVLAAFMAGLSAGGFVFARRSDRIGGLFLVAAAHLPTTAVAAAGVDTEVGDDGNHRRDVRLVLILNFPLEHPASAVRATGRKYRLQHAVDVVGSHTIALATVLGSGLAPRLLRVLLALVARERRRLALLPTAFLGQLAPELLDLVTQRRVFTEQCLVLCFQRIGPCSQLADGFLEPPDQASAGLNAMSCPAVAACHVTP